jgi:hypothetical protein
MNQTLLEEVIKTCKVKFGNPTKVAEIFLTTPYGNSIYETILSVIENPSNEIDCQLFKIIVRIIMNIISEKETIVQYLYRNDVPSILELNIKSFLDKNPVDKFDYMVIDGLPGILIDDINIKADDKNTVLETYWYSPKITADFMNLISIKENTSNNSIYDIEWPGIHCICIQKVYTSEKQWFYFCEKGIMKVKNYTEIIDSLSESLKKYGDYGLIVMNPEDTFIY